MNRFLRLAFIALALAMPACNSDDIDDIKDAVDGPKRKQINIGATGVNAFGNNPQFGSICSQFSDIRDNLNLKYIRVLIQWNDGVQPTPSSTQFFGFYDNVIDCIPPGADALLVVTGLPSWMSNSANWTAGNPRSTFVEKWFRKVVQRYRDNPRVVGFEVWNEPNMQADPQNTTMQFVDAPELFVEMQALAYSVAKDLAPAKLVLNAATTSLVQNYPSTLNYNKEMQAAGIEEFVDVYNIHYYGEQVEKFIDGGRSFLKGLKRPIWITESGAQGVNKQLAYVETMWPYLTEQVSAISRIYYYQYDSTAPAESTFGLRTTTASAPVSDLYVYLRDQ